MTRDEEIQRQIENARKDFYEQSKPYFDELSRVHAYGLRGYILKDGNCTPVYSDSALRTIKSIYIHIDYLSASIMKYYELDGSVNIPTITRPAL